MSSLTLDRPSFTQLTRSVFDAVLAAPERLAHVREMQREVERIMALTDEDLQDMGTTRDALLHAVAQSA